jgi:hypothetical protein
MRWLGREYPDTNSSEDPLTSKELKWHYLVVDNLEVLFSVRLPLSAKIIKGYLRNHFQD